MSGVVTRIYLRPSARTPVKRVSETRAITGRGLEGDHAGGGARQVTVLSEEAWADVQREMDRDDLDPGGRRANIVVQGVKLADAIKGGLRIGDCLLRIAGETRPCRLMDDYAPGLQEALDPECRGGVYGRVLAGGQIQVGSPVQLLRAADLPEEPKQLGFSAMKGESA